MKNVHNTSYGVITKQYTQRDDGLYTVLYTVEYEGDTYIYTADTVKIEDARLLLYGIGQWYMDTALLLYAHYSINAMRLAYDSYQERGREKQ